MLRVSERVQRFFLSVLNSLCIRHFLHIVKKNIKKRTLIYQKDFYIHIPYKQFPCVIFSLSIKTKTRRREGKYSPVTPPPKSGKIIVQTQGGGNFSQYYGLCCSPFNHGLRGLRSTVSTFTTYASSGNLCLKLDFRYFLSPGSVHTTLFKIPSILNPQRSMIPGIISS